MDERACVMALGILTLQSLSLLLMEEQRKQQEMVQQKKKKPRKPKSCWTRDWLHPERRIQHGQYTTLLEELRLEDEQAFRNYTRMDPRMFDEILNKIRPLITKKTTNFRKPIDPGLKLACVFRYKKTAETVYYGPFTLSNLWALHTFKFGVRGP